MVQWGVNNKTIIVLDSFNMVRAEKTISLVFPFP
jgi:hypothetical protein